MSGLSAGQNIRLDVHTVDARNTPLIESSHPVVVDRTGRVTVRCLIRTGRLDASLKLRVVDSQTKNILCEHTIRCSEEPQANPDSADPVCTRLQLFRHDVPFLLSIGPLHDLNAFLSEAASAGGKVPLLVGYPLDSSKDFPSSAAAMEVFTTVMISGFPDLNSDQLQALKTWVRDGGHLILTGSSEITTGLSTPFGQWLQSRFGLLTSTRRAGDRELAAVRQLLPQSPRMSAHRNQLSMLQIRSDQVDILAESPSGPLIAQSAAGGGRITLIAVNLSSPFLAGWNAFPDLYARLILEGPLEKAASASRTSRISSSGVTDLTTQLMASVDAVPQTGRWSIWSVIAVSFGWLLLIGPVDWFLVVVLFRRPHLTWLTFPLWTGTALTAVFFLKPAKDSTVLNTVHIVDVASDQNEQFVRTRSFMSVSIPETRQIHVRALPARPLSGPDAAVNLHWAGRPEDVYGGMYRASGLSGSLPAYRHSASSPDVLDAVPVLIDGSFEAQTLSAFTPERPLLESTFSVSGFGLLTGTMTHHLPVPIEDWFIVCENRVYLPATDGHSRWDPDTAWSFQRGRSRVTDLRAWLTGRRAARSESSDENPTDQPTAARYRAAERDPLDIVTMMSLYQTAGGSQYTGLTHHTLEILERSHSVRSGYALLVGRMHLDAVRYSINDRIHAPTKTDTIVRILFPVRRQSASNSYAPSPEAGAQTASESVKRTDHT